jgi:hypothetical protein
MSGPASSVVLAAQSPPPAAQDDLDQAMECGADRARAPDGDAGEPAASPEDATTALGEPQPAVPTPWRAELRALVELAAPVFLQTSAQQGMIIADQVSMGAAGCWVLEPRPRPRPHPRYAPLTP